MFKEVTRNYKVVSYDPNKEIKGQRLYEITVREYPPQVRTVLAARHGPQVISFPYLQFYFLRNTEIQIGWPYITGSTESVFLNGEPKGLVIPNCSSDGMVCLGDYWNPKNIDDVVNKFWFAKFENGIVHENEAMLSHFQSLNIPNVAQNQLLKKSAHEWIPLDNV